MKKLTHKDLKMPVIYRPTYIKAYMFKEIYMRRRTYKLKNEFTKSHTIS